MKSEDIDAIYKIILYNNDPDLIKQQLDKVSDENLVDVGLAKLYESDPNFVVEKLKKRLRDHDRIRLANNILLHKINEVGSGPVMEMFESLIDEGNPVLLLEGETVLQFFFPNFEKKLDWIAWCEKWKDEPKKEKVITKSLGLILTKLINYDPSEIRKRAIELLKHFSKRKDIDYDAETRKIDFGRDTNKGKDNKESTIKALYILDRILNPPEPIDVKTLLDNLKKAPHLCKVIDAEEIKERASSRTPHPLAYIFGSKLPKEDELERLRKELENEEYKNKEFWLDFKYQRLLWNKKCQSYWENVFRILEEKEVKIKPNKRKELQDVNNAWNTLAEFEVLSRLAPYFRIETEPDIPELGEKNLEARIEYAGEKVLIEVRRVQVKWEESLAYGVVTSSPGGKVKSILRNKFEGQLKEGNAPLKMPILIVLCLDEGFTDDEAINAIYGTPHFLFKINNDTLEIIENGTKRDINAFYDLPGTEIVTAIVAYQRDYDKEDSFVGKLYPSCKPPTNKMSPKFRLILECALFGNTSANEK